VAAATPQQIRVSPRSLVSGARASASSVLSSPPPGVGRRPGGRQTDAGVGEAGGERPRGLAPRLACPVGRVAWWASTSPPPPPRRPCTCHRPGRPAAPGEIWRQSCGALRNLGLCLSSVQAIVYEGQDKNPEMCRVLLTHEIMCR
jgi:hypothetical protein